jgi:hypothetical protein
MDWNGRQTPEDSVASSKPATIILLVIGLAVWVLLAVVLTSTVLYKGAYIWYLLYSPSSERECKDIRPGMDLNQVTAITHKHTEPHDQGLLGQEIYFSRSDGTCHVEMDPASKQVKRVYVTKDIQIR